VTYQTVETRLLCSLKALAVVIRSAQYRFSIRFYFYVIVIVSFKPFCEVPCSTFSAGLHSNVKLKNCVEYRHNPLITSLENTATEDTLDSGL